MVYDSLLVVVTMTTATVDALVMTKMSIPSDYVNYIPDSYMCKTSYSIIYV